MSVQYGWTYSGRANAGKTSRRNRYCKPVKPVKPVKKMKTLAVHAGGMIQHRPGLEVRHLEKAGRLVVACGLIVITFLVLGKQYAWQSAMSGLLLRGLESLKARPTAMLPAEAPAEAPPAAAAAMAPEKPAEKPVAGLPAASAPVAEPLVLAAPKPVAPKVLPALAAEAGAISVAQRDDAAQLPAVALISDGGLFCVNAAGRVWPLEGRTLPQDLPIVTGASVSELPGSMGIELRSELDMGLISRLLASGLADQFSEIHLDTLGGTVLYTREGVKILLGTDGAALDRDLKRLAAVLKDVHAKSIKIAMVDLRYDQHVVVRPETGKRTGM